MKICKLEKNNIENLELFLSRESSSLFYYSLKYIRFLENFLKSKVTYWLAINDDNIQGVLPLMEINGEYGKVINTLPYYGSNGGVLASSVAARDALYEKYNDIISSSDVAAATYIPNFFTVQDHPPKIKYDFIDERIGQVTSLKCEGDFSKEIFKKIDSSTRRNIRKAIKSKVEVSVNNDALDFLLKTHHENMGVIGGREKSVEFFTTFPKHFEKNKDYKIYVAKLDGKLISALLIFYYNETVEYFTPVTKEEFRSIQPMALILHTAMVDAVKDGYKNWNWGATWPSQHGVYKFKGKWGAQDYPYRYYVKINNKEILEKSPSDILEKYPNFYVVPFNYLKD